MKKILYIALSIILSASIVACSDDPATGEVDLGYLGLESSDVNFDYNGGIGTIVAKTTSTVTAKSADETWCEVFVYGNEVSVVISPYDGLQSRSTSIKVSADDRSVVVPVTQTPLSFGIASKSLSFQPIESNADVSFEAPNDIIVTGTSSDDSWATVVVNNNTKVAFISVTQNPGLKQRTATISLTAGDITKSIAVTQAGKAAELSDIVGTYAMHAVENWEGDKNYTVTIAEKSGNTVTITGVGGSPVIVFDATLNPSTNTMTFSSGINLGINYAGYPMYVYGFAATITFNIVDIGKMQTTERWGLYLPTYNNNVGAWFELYNETTLTRQ